MQVTPGEALTIVVGSGGSKGIHGVTATPVNEVLKRPEIRQKTGKVRAETRARPSQCSPPVPFPLHRTAPHRAVVACREVFLCERASTPALLTHSA
jgi:hypothetical protein